MELQGKIIAQTERRSGTNARGEWMAQDFVIETHEQYPKKMVFSVMGADRLQRFNIQIGQEVNVSFDIDAHEYNGRWFNNIRAFDVRQIDPNAVGATGAAPMPAAEAAPQAAPFPPADATPAEGGESSTDDLPF